MEAGQIVKTDSIEQISEVSELLTVDFKACSLRSGAGGGDEDINTLPGGE
jgi:hypothetical protein